MMIRRLGLRAELRERRNRWNKEREQRNEGGKKNQQKENEAFFLIFFYKTNLETKFPTTVKE